MSRHKFRPASRRRVLQFLTTGPLLTAGPLAAFAQGLPARPPDPMVWAPRDPDNVITDPKQALDVFDFEPAAKKTRGSCARHCTRLLCASKAASSR